MRIVNSERGLAKFAKHLKKAKIAINEALFCCEHTGLYTYPLRVFSLERKWKISIQNGMQIKKSMGVQRGKNDQIDAERIARYALRFEDKCQLWEAPRQEIETLRQLASERNRLIRVKKQLQVPLQEQVSFLPKKLQKEVHVCSKDALRGIENSLKKIEKSMQALVKQDDKLHTMMDNILSVEGIGMMTAIQLVIVTNEFRLMHRASQIACYAGVAPFPHQSGTSIRGRNRVSHLANKALKTLLHMCAISAIRNSEELSAYYKRRLAEKKAKMSIINAVRNKLIARVCACIRDNRKYEKKYAPKFG